MKRVLLFFLLFFFAGCGTSNKSSLGPYSIGRDPSWFPLRLEQMAVNINGFTNGLVQELAKVEHKDFRLVDVGWNQLFEGLEKEDYAGIFTSLPVNDLTKERYTFSNPFLLLGPVLVVPISSNARSLADLEGGIVGAYQYDDSVLIVQKYPSIIISLYQNFNEALEDVVNGNMDGALVPILEAQALIDNLYANELKIATPPLDNKGLRLITLKGKHSSLIQHFNMGLKKLENMSSYHALRLKFGVK